MARKGNLIKVGYGTISIYLFFPWEFYIKKYTHSHAPVKTNWTIWWDGCQYSKSFNKLVAYYRSLENSSIIHNSQKVEATQLFIDGLVNKQNVVHPYNGNLAFKRKVNLTHATTWINLQDIMLSKMSQTHIIRLYLYEGSRSYQIHRDRK